MELRRPMAESENESGLRAALCEDDAVSRRLCASLLRALFRERGFPLRLDLFGEAAALRAACASSPARYDLLLLGETLGGEDGIALAQELRAQGCRACLAFLAETPDRAFQSFRAAPADYLLRPVTRESMARFVDRALGGRRRTALPVETERGLRRVYACDVVYVEVADRTLALHLKNGAVTASGSLTALQERLPAETFFRCHKSYLVNLDFVESVYRYRALVRGGAAIPVGKSRYLALRDAFAARMDAEVEG